MYLDLDGVFADFEGHYRTKFGESIHEAEARSKKEMWIRMSEIEDFYADMPMTPRGDELFNHINCEDWAAHGGKAIKHLTGTVEETIEALQEIL